MMDRLTTRNLRHWLGVAALVTVPGVAQAAQDPATAGRAAIIHGRVLEQGRARALEGAIIILMPENVQAITDKDGRFLFEGIVAGVHTLRSALEGHDSREDSVRLDLGETVDVLLRLGSRSREVDPIEVAVRSVALTRAEFYDRRDHARGTFLGPADLARRNARVTTDLFRTMPSVDVGQGGQGSRTITFRRGVSCSPDIYVDNQRLGAGFDVDQLRPDDLLAIEVYMSGSIPQAFTSSTCGVIVFWTRRRGS
jgi:hypothetical protein